MKIKEKKAISLIVLVITIIVLAILATTVILSISSTDIVNESKLTVFKSDMTTYNDMYDMYVIEKIMNDITFDESNLTLTYKDSEYDNIFGKVPDKYKKGLKVINGKLVYETSDEREKEIIEELGLVADKIKIVIRLTNCTSSSSVTGVEYGASFNTTITANTGYTLQKVAVVMNGVDVTNSAYNATTKTITLNSVVGNIVITVVAEEEDPLAGVTIPDGFYYVGGTKKSGVVISDDAADENKGVDYTCVGNQFVWVPVDYTPSGTTDSNGLDTGFTAVFKRGSASNNTMTGTSLSTAYAEPYESNLLEVKEYNAMCKSVQTYGGFYIARFEAGDSSVTSARKRSSGVGTVVSKKGAYVYNHVKWGDSMTSIGTTGAVYLSQQMYVESSSVVSTLCYGVQWDATMNFVADADHSITDSRSWGNHSNSTGDAEKNSGSSNMNYTTGRNEAWQAKNIYDLAGNVFEWTMEAYSSNYRVSRGGYYYSGGSLNPASYRNSGDPNYSYNGVGFRPTLYIVVE